MLSDVGALLFFTEICFSSELNDSYFLSFFMLLTDRWRCWSVIDLVGCFWILSFDIEFAPIPEKSSFNDGEVLILENIFLHIFFYNPCLPIKSYFFPMCSGIRDENDHVYNPKIVRIGLKPHHSIQAVSMDYLVGICSGIRVESWIKLCF